MEIRNAIETIWYAATETKKQEALQAENAVLGYNADEEKIITDLTGYFTDCVDCEVVDGVITIAPDDPAYTDIGSEIRTIDQLIDCIG
jgi:hypothetical protein|nr:MAG TPA: hypothetical protein [Caudoviricetes sp.]